MVLDLEREVLKPVIDWERSATVAFAAGAIVGIGAPMLLAPHLPRLAKLSSLLLGVTSSLSLTYSIAARQKNEKILNSLDAAQSAYLKQSLAAEVAKETTWAKIDAQRQLAAKISRLPIHEQGRWIAQYQLQGIIPQLEPLPERGSSPATGFSIGSQSSLSDMGGGVEVDYSWLDSSWLGSSKAVFGSRGSGKSTYLSYETLSFLQENPEGELRIGDLHYDEDESQWLPGVPPSVLLDRYLARKPEDILKCFRYCDRVLKERVEQGKKSEHPIYFVCDEFVGFMNRLSKEERDEVAKIIENNSFEARKYKVSIVLGLHSLKKGICNIDSSALLSGMNVLCLGSSLSDPATKFPADFDIKQLLLEQQQFQAVLPEGYACVMRKLGDAPQVVAIPHIDMSGVSVSSASGDRAEEVSTHSAEDPVASIAAWYHSLPSPPSDEKLIQKWYELTGVELNVEGLDEVRKYLSEKKDGTDY